MNIFKEKIISLTQSVISKATDTEVSAEDAERLIKLPPDASYGDYSVASFYFGKFGFKGKPEESAAVFLRYALDDFEPVSDYFYKIETKGPYVNFFVKKDKFVSEVIGEVLKNEAGYGKKDIQKWKTGKSKKVVIDFSSPNIAKPFGVGHLRSTVIGMSLSNIYEFCGFDVTRINYLGDFGTQFGMLVTAICRYWDDMDFSGFNEKPVKILYDLYVKIHKDAEKDGSIETAARENFRELERGLNDLVAGESFGNSLEDMISHYRNTSNPIDKESVLNALFALKNEIDRDNGGRAKLSLKDKPVYCESGYRGKSILWEKLRELSVEEFKKVYAMMGIDFDYYEGEAESGIFSSDLVKILLEAGLAEESEGAVIVPLKGMKTPALVAKSDGTSIYLSRDVVTAILRMAKFDFDKIIYVVGSEQSLHFNQLISLFALLAENSDKFDKYSGFRDIVKKISGKIAHVKFGRIIGMSTRKGNLVFLEDYIGEAKAKAAEKLSERPSGKGEDDETALKIGLGAVIFNDLKTRRNMDVNFNWDAVLSFEGQTGPYAQYTVSRINSLIDRLKKETVLSNNIPEGGNGPGSDKFEGSFSGINEDDEDFMEIYGIIKQVSLFGDALKNALNQDEPSVITSYVLELASLFNKYYQNYRLIGKGSGYIMYRINFLTAVVNVLTSALKLICIPVLARM